METSTQCERERYEESIMFSYYQEKYVFQKKSVTKYPVSNHMELIAEWARGSDPRASNWERFLWRHEEWADNASGHHSTGC